MLYLTPVADEACCDKFTAVETKAEGIPLEAFLQNAEPAQIREVERQLQRIVLKMIWEHKFFHADLHAGNIFISLDEDNKPVITLIDCGLCGTIDDNSEILPFINKLLIAVINPMQSKDRYYRALASLFKKEELAKYNKQLWELSKKICALPRNERILCALNGLYALPGYTPPLQLIHLLLAVSKTPFLYKAYWKNMPDYLKIFFGKQ